MAEKAWVDETFSHEAMVKSLTGTGTTSIDYSRLAVSPGGELQLVANSSSQSSPPVETNSSTTAPTVSSVPVAD